MELGIGAGYSILTPAETGLDRYTITGLGVRGGLGYAPTNRSVLVFEVKSNVFLEEVSTVWSNWRDKMSGDDIKALGAKLAAPFVYPFAPLFRSHSLFGSLEYSYYLRDQAPSLMFSAAAGIGLLYDRSERMPYGGLGLSAGTGYELARRAVLKFDVLYSTVASDLQGLSFLLTLNLMIY